MDVEALDRYLAERSAADQFSGVVRIDLAGQPLINKAYGWGSRTWQVPAQVDLRFDTASITKLFTAVAVLQQVAAGAFALDTPVTTYLALNGTTISPLATPYHLLTHTSGIGDDADEDAGESYEALFVDRPNYSIRDTADFLPQFVSKPPNFAPGEGCRYCNCSYVLLGLMVEKATGMTYRDYVRRHVFEPAGMTRSGFFAMDQVEPDIAEATNPVIAESGQVTGWRRNIYSYPPIGSPDGGAHVTASDLITFHRSLVAGRLMGPDLTREMLVPHEDYRQMGTGVHRTGYGFEFEVDGAGAVVSYWKEGINVGASGILAHYPQHDLTFVVLSNMEEGAWEPIKRVEEMVKAG